MRDKKSEHVPFTKRVRHIILSMVDEEVLTELRVVGIAVLFLDNKFLIKPCY
jgi:hypothetical protein